MGQTSLFRLLTMDWGVDVFSAVSCYNPLVEGFSIVWLETSMHGCVHMDIPALATLRARVTLETEVLAKWTLFFASWMPKLDRRDGGLVVLCK